MLRTRAHSWTFRSGVFPLVNSGHGVLIHLRTLDGVSLDVQRGHIGQEVSRWAAIECTTSWLSWRLEDQGGAGGSRSRGHRVHNGLQSRCSFNRKKLFSVWIQSGGFHLRSSYRLRFRSLTTRWRCRLLSVWGQSDLSLPGVQTLQPCGLGAGRSHWGSGGRRCACFLLQVLS